MFFVDDIDAVLTQMTDHQSFRFIFGNNFGTALLITLILIIIVMSVSTDIQTKDLLKTGFWTYLVMLSVVFLQNKVLMGESMPKSSVGNYYVNEMMTANVPLTGSREPPENVYLPKKEESVRREPNYPSGSYPSGSYPLTEDALNMFNSTLDI